MATSSTIPSANSSTVGFSNKTTTSTTFSPPPNTTKTAPDEAVIPPLVNHVMTHYEDYYRAESMWAKHDVLGMLTPSWRTSLEDAFLWIGGWRPSMAFHLLYSRSGLQLEAQLGELIRGMTGNGGLGDLSPNQVSEVEELKRETIREEREITEWMAKHQETVADTSMVELSHVATELMRENGTESGGVEEDKVEENLEKKKYGLEEILQTADDLRIKTLKKIVEILTTIQAVHFLIAAAELHLRVHEWGKKMEKESSAQQQHQSNTDDDRNGHASR